MPFQTLGHIFAKPKDPVTKEQRTDTIYSIPCNDCDNEYIGQTKRSERQVSTVKQPTPTNTSPSILTTLFAIKSL